MNGLLRDIGNQYESIIYTDVFYRFIGGGTRIQSYSFNFEDERPGILFHRNQRVTWEDNRRILFQQTEGLQITFMGLPSGELNKKEQIHAVTEIQAYGRYDTCYVQ